MNTQAHPTEPSGEAVQRAAVGAPALIGPMSAVEYDRATRERADEGLGPFCDSYVQYVSAVMRHNAAVIVRHSGSAQ